MIATRGTAQRIRELGYECIETSTFTSYPESPRGLIRTAHPKIYGGFLLDPRLPDDQEYMRQHGIVPIDVLIANLYPFDATIKQEQITLIEVVKSIDIGGPALIRAAAKAYLLHGRVSVVTDPSKYEAFREEIEKNRGEVSDEFKRKLAREAFALTSRYDFAIQRYLSQLR